MIATMLLAIDNLLVNFDQTVIGCKRTDGQKSACDAMVVGGLMKATQRAGLWPYPKPPYKHLTVKGLEGDLQSLEIRTLCDITHHGYGDKTHGGEEILRSDVRHVEKFAAQTLKASISIMITSIYKQLEGLNIEKFK